MEQQFFFGVENVYILKAVQFDGLKHLFRYVTHLSLNPLFSQFSTFIILLYYTCAFFHKSTHHVLLITQCLYFRLISSQRFKIGKQGTNCTIFFSSRLEAEPRRFRLILKPLSHNLNCSYSKLQPPMKMIYLPLIHK